MLRRNQRRDAEALRHAGQALIQYRIAGDRPGEANALNSIGWTHALRGDLARGLRPLEKAVTLLRTADHSFNLASTLDSLGYTYSRLGEHDRAITCYQDAMSALSGLGVPRLSAVILDHLGDACLAAAKPGAARRAWHQALNLYTDADHHRVAGVRAKLAAR